MSIGAILIGIAMLVVAVSIVARPLDTRRRVAMPNAKSPHSTSEAYQATLLALRDLELDHQTGVVTAEDYARLREALMAQAAQALAKEEAAQADLEARIETAVRAHRRQNGDSPQRSARCERCHLALDPDDRFCPQCGTVVALSCSHCHQPHQPDDRFCTACGTSLATVGESQSADQLEAADR